MADPARDAAPLLAFHDLTLGYDRHPAVHHLTGAIAPGALMAIAGPNGGGKSTLLKAIAGRLAPLGGRIENRAARLAYMPQIADLSRDFPISVLDLALTGLCGRRGMFGGLARAEREAARAAIEAVGLHGFETRSIRTLSGGQLQRLLFARLMLQDADLILLDEPFTAIDARTTEDLVAIIHRWHGEGRTVLAVLHDLPLIRAHFPETLLLARDPVGWGPTPAILTESRLAAARTMSEAFDRFAPECTRAA
ncbi:MAG: ABC transporter ATP-binding protein [Hyphomicrobiales bacterium]|nr:ABC transporter ATP-binding protein [Hyphomicrobiales bacterium]MCA1998727.1 ABC transporter ATP-binding protein [Hyphomicrobiales bacterium]